MGFCCRFGSWDLDCGLLAAAVRHQILCGKKEGDAAHNSGLDDRCGIRRLLVSASLLVIGVFAPFGFAISVVCLAACFGLDGLFRFFLQLRAQAGLHERSFRFLALFS